MCALAKLPLLLSTIVVLGILVGRTYCIDCYVCDTSETENPFQCGEWFERYDEPDIQPQNCSNVHDAKYCVKHVGRFEGGVGAKRFCSNKDLGNYCDFVRNKGDRMDYRSCIYTCYTDGCNSATQLQQCWKTLFVVVVLIILLNKNIIK